MPGYLPDPPQIPVAGMGPHPTPQMNNSPSWNNPQAIAQGIASFAQNYMLAQRQSQQDAASRVEQSIKLRQMGVPIDEKQLVKDIKKSKIPIALDPESAGAFDIEKAQMGAPQQQPPLPQAQAMMLAGGQMPVQGSVPRPTPPGMVGPQNPETANVPIPGAMGGAVPVSPQQAALSPEMAAASARPGPSYMQQKPIPTTLHGFLDQLGQQGWDEKQMKGSMQNILRGALTGDNRALEMATRLGLTKTIGAHDELFLLADKLFPDKTPMEAQASVGKMLLYDIMGGPQMDAKKIDTAKAMMPYFNNSLEQAREYVNDVFDGRQPKVQPQMSFDQFKDVMKLQGDILGQFPTSGNLPAVATTLMMAGRTKEAQQVVSAIAEHYPSKDSMEMYQKERAFNWDKTKFAASQNLDWARFNQGKQEFDKQYAMSQLNYLQGKAREQFDSFWKIYNDKNASNGQRNEAVTGLVDALKKQGIDVETKNVFALMHPFEGSTEIRVPNRGGQSVGTTMAGKPPKNPFTGADDPEYANGLWQYLQKFPGFVKDYFFGGEEEK